MKIGLIDVDSHGFPNLAIMKLSAWHKAQGDEVEWWWGFSQYDIVYKSKVFDDTYSKDVGDPCNAKQIIKGGTGYGLSCELPYEVEHIYPDYSLYPSLTENCAYGFLSRGCPRACPFCIVAEKEGRKSHRVAHIDEWWKGQKNIVLLDPNTLAAKEHMEILGELADTNAWVDFNQGIDARLLTEENINALNKVKTKAIHFAWDLMSESNRVLKGLDLYLDKGKIKDRRRRVVYVLVNYNTTTEEDLYRVYTLRDMGYDPYVMVYDKPNSPKTQRQIQRWVNNRRIFGKVKTFGVYNEREICENAVIDAWNRRTNRE